MKIHDFFNSGSKVSSWGHLDLVWSPTCGELCKMAFPAPLGKKGGTAQTTYEPFTRVPLASHGFPSFWEKDGISDSTASLSSCALALIAENGSAPSRFGHEQQGLLDINQGESGERGGLGAPCDLLSTQNHCWENRGRVGPCGGRKPRGPRYKAQDECQGLTKSSVFSVSSGQKARLLGTL